MQFSESYLHDLFVVLAWSVSKTIQYYIIFNKVGLQMVGTSILKTQNKSVAISPMFCSL